MVNQNINNEIDNYLNESLKIAEYQKIIKNQIIEISTEMQESLDNGGKIIICGNGGSAADAQHIAAELVVRFKENRESIPAISLTTDTSILTSIGNDLGFKFIFSRQLESIGKDTDFLILISTSGKSENILECMKEAKKIGMKTLSLIGNDSSLLDNDSDYIISIPSDVTGVIQQAHITIGQLFCMILESNELNK
tara:strand:+ start:103 stop:687 length:585 start_codon:yes stop_codon:yes gene_type:complete